MSGYNIIFVHRDAWQKDVKLNKSLVDGLSGEGINILLEGFDPIRAKLIENLPRLRKAFYWLPVPAKIIGVYIIQFLYGILHPSYLPHIYKKIDLPNNIRCAELRKMISEIDDNNPIIIVSRSAGCIMSTTIADEFNIAHIICIGYPFKHPENGEQPYRYEHLENLNTPTLIIQGCDDEYGGKEIVENYELSSNIELFFIDADHGFNLSKDDMNTIIKKMKTCLP